MSEEQWAEHFERRERKEMDRMEAKANDKSNEHEHQELLTVQEHELIETLGICASEFTKITGSDKRVRENDLIGFVHGIHILQHTVMAQAAARAYPERYRRAGELGLWEQWGEGRNQ